MTGSNTVLSKKHNRKRRQPKGRQVESDAVEEISALLDNKPLQANLLIEYLHLIQDRYHQLSAEHLTALASLMKLSQTEVFEVATFYHHFDVVKEGQNAPPALTVRVCDSVTCEMFGANELINSLDQILGSGIRIQRVPCVGHCDSAPVAVVGKNTITHASTKTVSEAAKNGLTEADPNPYIHYQEYSAAGGYQTFQQCVSGKLDAETILKSLEDSRLRGLGGAGFPVGQKWRIVSNYDAPRLMAVNIDEGEPGTFKDRFYLEQDPHRFLEGMLIAAQVVGIDAIYIYLRDEYAGCRKILTQELASLRAAFPNTLPEIQLRRGAGAYICGEESAMIESIEGKRGMPRLRPPYVAEVGLFGRPTLEHNMETLFWVREILEKGGDWFASLGRHGRFGLRSFSVSGRVNNPGVHLAPAGITMHELIDEFCGGMLPGHELYGYFPGGASGGVYPASLGDVPMDFDTLNEYGGFIGSAAVIVLSDQDSAKAAATNAMRFFEHESCGQCTPCRVGTAKAVRLMEKPKWDVPLMQELADVMIDASICGLGQAAPNPMQCVIKYFPEEIES